MSTTDLGDETHDVWKLCVDVCLARAGSKAVSVSHGGSTRCWKSIATAKEVLWLHDIDKTAVTNSHTCIQLCQIESHEILSNVGCRSWWRCQRMCVPESRSHSHTTDWCRNDALDFWIRVMLVPPLPASRLAVDVDDDSELHILVPVEAAARISVCHKSSNLNSCYVFVWLPCFVYIPGSNWGWRPLAH